MPQTEWLRRKGVSVNKESIKISPEIINEIEWDMTPEDAVSRYLEWGGSWAPENKVVRSSNDTSYYFMVSTWDDPPKVRLMKITHHDAEELALIIIPQEIMGRFVATLPQTKNVYPINPEIRHWLEDEFLPRFAGKGAQHS